MVCYSKVLAKSSFGASLGLLAEQLMGRVFGRAFCLLVGSSLGSWEGQASEQALVKLEGEMMARGALICIRGAFVHLLCRDRKPRAALTPPRGSLPYPAPFPTAFGGDAGRVLRQPASAQVHLDPFNLSLRAVKFGQGKMDGWGFISSGRAALLVYKPADCWRCAAGNVGGFGGLGARCV